ncbi:MAG: serine/threonine protein kinase [Anaerolineae bacterium]|nr:serine/threonine protein kinase [Anaerolineae bacterium]
MLETQHPPTTTTQPILATQIIHPGRRRAARWIWVVLVVFNTVFGLVNLGIYTSQRLQPCLAEPCYAAQIPIAQAEEYTRLGIPFAAAALLRPVFELLWVMVYTGIGIVIFRRRSDDWMGMLTGLMLCLMGFQLTYSIETLTDTPLTLSLSLFLTSLMTLVTYTVLYLFPSGRFTSRWAIVALAVTLPYELVRGVAINVPALGLSPGLMLLGTVILTLVALGLQFQRYRTLAQAERQQIKWVLFAFVFLIGGLALSAVQRAVIPELRGAPAAIAGVAALMTQTTFYLALPLGMAFSMLRYRLWDADLVINRALVYTGSLVVVGALFVGLFFVANAVLSSLIGLDTAATVVLAAVVIGAGFNSVRRWVGRWIDRNVYNFRVPLDTAQRHISSGYPPVPPPHLQAGRHVGQQIGGYTLDNLLGRGAMSEVYAAHELSTGKKVAVKVLAPDIEDPALAVGRFKREADALRRITHPNVIRMVTSGMSEGVYYLAMEVAGRQTLWDRMQQPDPIPPAEAISLVRDIAAGLDAVHRVGVVHRDVKPSNILLRPTDYGVEAVLIDFGVVRVDSEASIAQRKEFIGTLHYAAPEQLMANRQADHRADIYALGVIAYQLLTGHHPFDVSAAAMIFAHLNQPPTDPRQFKPHLPRLTVQALLRALAKKPEDRYPSASAFAAALVG